MADFGNYNRDTEDQDIEREGTVAVGSPTGGSLLEQLRSKFEKLDKTRHKIIKVVAKNGEPFWLELVIDIDEDELREARKRSEVGTRAEKRAGTAEVSMARLGAEIINLQNTRIWAADPATGAAPVADGEGDDLMTRSREWCELLDHPGDPIGALQYLLGDMALVDLFNVYSDVAGLGEDGATVVDPTRA